jgi:hypothetical protein
MPCGRSGLFRRDHSAYPVQIHTRLPAPETNFQNNQPIQTDNLPDGLSETATAPVLHPAAESTLLATLCGKCMSHRRLATAAVADPREFWARHESLSAAVERRRQALAQNFFWPSLNGVGDGASGAPPPSHHNIDPLLICTYVLTQGVIIHLSMTAEMVTWQSVEHQVKASIYERRAFQAVVELIRLSKVITRMGRFTVRLKVSLHKIVENLLTSPRPIHFYHAHSLMP